MSYLTGAAPAVTAGTARRSGLGVPGLAHPLLAPDEWARIARPGAPVDWAVLDIADGPGTRPDPHCLRAASRLRAGGVRVLGRLDTAWGERSFGALISEAHRYLDWYRVDGFLLARCPADRADLIAVRRVVTTLRVLREDAHVVLGHGTHPCPGYAEIGDQLITYSGPWSDYRWSQAAEWSADHPPERFCHLVHGVPRGHLEEALRVARWQGAATLWFTDRSDGGGQTDPWAGLPGYWDEIVSLVGTGVSE
ncbi:spherulation-specific family 4 protein [Streptomyces sp. NPDC003717]|uniref:spherulation-specific family 4 protein n=1 Tax=Streptomyces sp. NPDC003717 TaxID=3154276 RepID=UPI0033A96D60